MSRNFALKICRLTRAELYFVLFFFEGPKEQKKNWFLIKVMPCFGFTCSISTFVPFCKSTCCRKPLTGSFPLKALRCTPQISRILTGIVQSFRVANGVLSVCCNAVIYLY
jgi:hypothetical protein